MKRPLAHIGFSVGITLIVLNLIKDYNLLVITIGLVAIFVTSLVLSKYRKALALPLCLGGMILACIIFSCTYESSVKPSLNLDNKVCDAEFYIVDLAQEKNNSYTYIVKTKLIECENAPQTIKLKLNTREKINADSYQVIRGKLKFNKISDNALNSYGSWADNIYLSARLNNYTPTNETIPSINKYVLLLRENILDTLSSSLNGDSAGLASALLIGDKTNLTRKAYNNFKLSGATHIMAVSGMHLVVISSVFIFIFKKLGLNQTFRSIITIPLIFVYAALAGFSKSVIRAGIIMIVLLIGELFKRKGDSLNSLGLAVLILCFNPFVVCDVGAMLSVLSTLSLITLLPLVNKRIVKIKIFNMPVIKSIVQSVCISLCVMLYTLPVLYVSFGYMSIAGIIANIILVPLGSIAMVLALLLYITSPISIVVSCFALATDFVCRVMLNFVSVISKLPYAIMPLNHYIYAVLAGALLITGIAFITNRKKNIKIATIMSVLLVFIGVVIPFDLDNGKDKLVVFGDNAIIVECDNKALIANLKDYEDFIDIKNYLLRNNIECDTILLSNKYEDDKYNILLSHSFKPNNIVSFGNAKTLYSMPRVNVVDGNESVIKFGNSTFDYLDKNNKEFVVKLNDFTISNCEYIGSDIRIHKNYIEDCNGNIDLSYSNVVYCLNSDNTFTVRRFD